MTQENITGEYVTYNSIEYSVYDCTMTVDGYVPTEVFEEYYVYISSTDEYHHTDNCCVPKGHDDWYLIEDCTYSNYDEEYIHDDDLKTTYNGEQVHEDSARYNDYYNDYFTEHDEMDMYWSEYHSAYLLPDDCQVCDSCGEVRHYDDDACCRENSVIDDYSSAHFQLIGTESRRVGIELEVELENAEGYEVAEILNTGLPRIGFVTNDDSLSNGFELVTNPYDYNSFFALNWQDTLQQLSSEGCRAYDTSTCGLHVHITRPANVDKSKQHYELKRFAAKHRAFLERFAMRDCSRYANFDDINRDNWQSEKFAAINILHHDTIEFRLFKGSLNFNRIRASVELCFAIMEYLFPLDSVPILQDFAAWLDFNNSPRYAHLKQYIQDKNLSI